MGKKLQPKLRFRGFTDAWEQRRLGEVAEIGTGSHNTQDGHLAGPYPFFIRSDQKLFLDDFDYDEEAILIPGDGRIGQIYHYMNGKYALHQRVYRIKVDSSVDTRFILYSMESRFRKHALAMNSQGTVPSLRKPIFTEWGINLPEDRSEQVRISILFSQLDNLIAAEKRKLNLLEQKSEAYFQKIFLYGSYHGKGIRHWKTVYLGDIATRVTRRNKGQSSLPLTISARDGLIDQREYFSKQVASKDLDNYILLQRGEFAYNKSTSSDSPWGAIKRLDSYDQGCVSTLYICFSMHGVDSQFITTLFNSSMWHREIQAIAAEGARNHGLLNISPKDFFDIQLQIPDSLSEQKHIGRFFATYEQLLRQTVRRIELLEKKKRALLQAMFI